MRLATKAALWIGIAIGAFGNQIVNVVMAPANASDAVSGQMAGPPQDVYQHPQVEEVARILELMKLPIKEQSGNDALREAGLI